VFAPGASIYSSTRNLSYASWDGTSMASPHVAGAAALYLSANPTASATTVNSWVVSNATTGVVSDPQTGSPNRLLYTLGLGTLQTLTVSRNGTGTGTVTSNPSAINCGSTCSSSFADGSPVTLTATPSATSEFTSWTGCTSTSGTSCTVTMNAAKTVTATFTALPTYTLSVSKAGSGTGTVSSNPAGVSCGSACLSTSASFVQDAQVTLTATPTTGHSFTGWTGACTNATGTCTVTMDAAKSVTATFAQPPAASMHLGAMTGTKKTSKSSWSASTTVTMHSATHAALSSVLVTVSFSGATSGTASCTTNSRGSCTVTRSGLSNNASSITFTVTGATRSGYSYNAAENDRPNSVTINR